MHFKVFNNFYQSRCKRNFYAYFMKLVSCKKAEKKNKKVNGKAI